MIGSLDTIMRLVGFVGLDCFDAFRVIGVGLEHVGPRRKVVLFFEDLEEAFSAVAAADPAA